MILLLTILFFILAGVTEGVMDKLQFHYQVSKFKDFKNHLFWDPYHSWRNKYKNGNPEEGERFPLSTTLLVGFTDAWHFFKLLRNLFIFIAVSDTNQAHYALSYGGAQVSVLGTVATSESLSRA